MLRTESKNQDQSLRSSAPKLFNKNTSQPSSIEILDEASTDYCILSNIVM